MRQRLGQHYLHDPEILETILSAANLSKKDVVIEVGPGRGILTEPLASRVAQVIAVELDHSLAQTLTERYATHPRLRIVQGDFLKQDLEALRPPDVDQVKILGNLPYAVAAPIVEKILTWPHWKTGVFLVQKEVAERMQSPHGSRAFGILSLAMQLFSNVEVIALVPPESFRPPPEVTSAVIRLTRREAPGLPEADIPAFFDLARGAFAHRRKTIANSLCMHAGLEKFKVETWLQKMSVSAGARAEELALETYLRLAPEWATFRRETVI